MRKSLLKLFLCPNHQIDGFRVFAHKLKRDNQFLSNIDHEDIDDNDDVISGFIINEKTSCVYPITNFILSALPDKDADYNLYINLLTSTLKISPQKYIYTIQKNIERLMKHHNNTTGNWNQQEMEYFDKDVETEAQRKAFYEKIKKEPLWHIYLERKKYLLSDLKLPEFSNILEIGCGNARTTSWLFPPKKHRYNYIGTDISLKRLMLAKMVIPDGDFIQCSALNLPFNNETFAAVFSFGVLHHLENPSQGAITCLSKICKDGYFIIHEPLEKPKKILSKNKYLFLNKVMKTYDHSEHDNHINLRDILKLFREQGCKIHNMQFNASILRTIGARIFMVLPRVNKSENAWKVLIAIDKAFIKLFCSKPNVFGPCGVFIKLQKIQ